jgi:hypothetical protein
MDAINRAQQLQLDLLRLASANALDGDQVANDLEAHLDLWEAAVIKRDDLISLRDLHRGVWNADTLYVVAAEGREDELLELAQTWGADNVGYLDPEVQLVMGIGPDYNGVTQLPGGGWLAMGKGNPDPHVLKCWWD